MGAKRAKLDFQFHSKDGGGGDEPRGMFAGISIHINGYTDPPEDVLRGMFTSNGGRFTNYNNGAKTTYIIATNLSAPSKRLYGTKTLRPEWITESVAAGRLLDPKGYFLYDFNKERKQSTLSQFMKPSSSAGDNPGPSTSKLLVKFPPGLVVTDEMDVIPSSGSTVSIDGDESTEDENDFLPPSDDEEERQVKKEVKGQPGGSGGTGHAKTASEEGFLEDFFAHSRLHLISSHKKAMQNRIGRMRVDLNTAEGEFPLLEEFVSEVGRSKGEDEVTCCDDRGKTLMHIDLDCFFVSVGLLSRPHLIGQPVVVTHSTKGGVDSKADIASASYEARREGVKNGMWVGEAKKLCPTLNVIPYDFEEYKRVSQEFFLTVAKLTLDIEVASVDEMIVDVTSVLEKVKGATPIRLAEFIRKHIKEVTKCTASVGIGSNRLLAKLATKKAKPNGAFHLEDSAAGEFISALNVGDLPGVGYSTKDKLRLSGVSTCGELLVKLPLHRLGGIVGHKTASKLLQFCRGKDIADLQLGYDRPKSLSVDVNFGIRFDKNEALNSFLVKLCEELSRRAEVAEASCRSLTLKVLIRRKGAGDPVKQGGHGVVDASSKSCKFHVATRGAEEFVRNVKQMMAQVLRGSSVSVSDLRGIGLTMGDLTFAFDESRNDNQKKKTLGHQQKTLQDAFSSRGRLILNSALTMKTSTEVSATSTSVGKKASTSTPASTSSDPSEVIPEAPAPRNQDVNTFQEDKVDINVLRELPKDIREEMAKHYGIDVDMIATPPPPSKSDAVNKLESAKAAELNSANLPGPSTRMTATHPISPAQESTVDKAMRGVVNFQPQTSPQPGTSKGILKPFSPPRIRRRRRTRELCFGVLENDAANVSSSSDSSSDSDDSSDNETGWGLFEDAEAEYNAQPTIPFAAMEAMWAESGYTSRRFDRDETAGLPSLSGRVAIPDIRNLIREGIQAMTVPSPEDVTDLREYFKNLVERGWVSQLAVLLKFLYRQMGRVGQGSPWCPIIEDIIIKCEETCRKMFTAYIPLEPLDDDDPPIN